MRFGFVALACWWLAAGFASAPAWAQEDFYKGKQLRLVVSTDAGGAYDTYARLASQILKDHIPGNPTIIVQNMPGAGGLKAANYIATTAPRDGTVIAATHASILTAPLTSPGVPRSSMPPASHGSAASPPIPFVGYVWHTAADQDARRPADHRGHHGRSRGRHRKHRLRHPGPRHVRAEAQARQRLQILQRREAGDGARRGAGHLRQRLEQPAQRRAGLDPRREDPDHRAARLQAAAGAARCSAVHQPGADRRRPRRRWFSCWRGRRRRSPISRRRTFRSSGLPSCAAPSMRPCTIPGSSRLPPRRA